MSTESQLEKIITMGTRPFIDNINLLALPNPLKYSHKNCYGNISNYLDHKQTYMNFVEKPDNMSK